MSSFISAFKGLIAAAILIVGIEATVGLTLRPSFVERSNYLNLIYGQSEVFHKLIIYKKLDELLKVKPDIIQVGDSSGLHGIRPSIVMEELGGLRYFNLSCCANTGFAGYYDIARFAIERVPNIKAIVVYATVNNLPRPQNSVADQIVGAAKLHDSFVGPWSTLSPPSMALRPALTRELYTGGKPTANDDQIENPATAEMLSSIKRDSGWWPEHDPRKTQARNDDFYRRLCGNNDTLNFSTLGAMSADGKFLPLVTFDRIAELAESYGKKLIVVIHPHPCQSLNEQFRKAVADAFSTLRHKHANFYFYPDRIFEHWPRSIFSGADHLRVGYEGYSSRRLARFVASALNVPPQKGAPALEVPTPRAASLPAGPRPIWTGSLDAGSWRLQGLTASQPSPRALKLAETTAVERHYFETTVPGLTPRNHYLFELTYRPEGDRTLSITLRDGSKGNQGSMSCDALGGEATRRGDLLDADIIAAPSGSTTCRGIIQLTQDKAVLGIDVIPTRGGFPYQGDGRSGILLKGARIYRLDSPNAFLNVGG